MLLKCICHRSLLCTQKDPYGKQFGNKYGYPPARVYRVFEIDVTFLHDLITPEGGNLRLLEIIAPEASQELGFLHQH